VKVSKHERTTITFIYSLLSTTYNVSPYAQEKFVQQFSYLDLCSWNRLVCVADSSWFFTVTGLWYWVDNLCECWYWMGFM